MLIQLRKFLAFRRFLDSLRGVLAACALLPLAAAPAPLEDSMAQRVLACTGCHGAQGRAAPDGYYPRIAGKPAGYLYNQLVNFRQGRRQYHLMAQLLDPLSDTYVQEIALHFASLELPYPPAGAAQATAQQLQRGAQLVREGDKAQDIPACDQCHGKALTGTLPGVPGLLGLPRDYLNAQLGAWQVGRRQAHAPDCMATVARRMQVADVAAVSAWLASQPLPAKPQAVAAGPTALPLDCGSARQTPPGASTTAASARTADLPTLVERGRYLAVLGNCQACHTRRGGAPYAGGRGIATPFGTVFSSNLTPSPAGLGAWSADDFWRALHLGQSRDGHVLYPAFPYTNTTHMTRPDSDALFAYLRTLAPQADKVPAHQLRWPFNTQTALHVWRALYFREGSATQPLPRGEYLVQALAHCSACHAPRNALGASINGQALAGGLIPVQNWYAPSLTNPAQAGVQDWPLADIVALFQTGRAGNAMVSGPMAEVVQNSTQHWAPDDVRAMALYLKQLAPTPEAGPGVPPAPGAAGGVDGARLYEKHCAECHGDRGQGKTGSDGSIAYPRLAGNRGVTLASPVNAVQTVLNGGFAPVTAGHPRPFGMPPFVLELNDSQIAAILTYVRSQWSNRAPPVSELDVLRVRRAGMP